MTKLSKAALLAQINTLINDNTNQEVSAADVRSVLTDIRDSLLGHPDEMGAAAALDGTEILGSFQAGAEVKIPLADLSDFVNSVVLAAAGMNIFFDKRKQFGTFAAPEAGPVVTVDLTGALPHMEVLLIHQAGAQPAYPGIFKPGYGVYDPAKKNLIWMRYIDATHIIYNIENY